MKHSESPDGIMTIIGKREKRMKEQDENKERTGRLKEELLKKNKKKTGKEIDLAERERKVEYPADENFYPSMRLDEDRMTDDMKKMNVGDECVIRAKIKLKGKEEGGKGVSGTFDITTLLNTEKSEEE